MAFPLFERAVNSIKSQVPLDLDLDVDNDGCIDYITFVMPGSIVYGIGYFIRTNFVWLVKNIKN